MTLRTVITVALVVTGFVLTAGSARADLADLIPSLFGDPDTGLLTQPVRSLGCCGPTGHAFHFRESALAENQLLFNGLNAGLQGQLANIPLPSPASGFTFQFDPSLGVFTRSTQSFGPIFSDRAETVGRGKFSVGFTYSRFTFDKLDGKDLRDGELDLTFGHEPTAELNRADPAGRGVGPAGIRGTPFPFEADTITAQVFLDITADVFAFSATYGLLDNLDVGILIPIIRIDVDARGIARINRLGGDLTAHVFLNGTDTQETRRSDESTGLGDIVLRGKYTLYRRPPVALAAALDLRLPTGDSDELRGLDTVRVRPFFIASANVFGIAPHVNLGFDVGGTSRIENEFFYKVGFDWAVIRPVTLAFDLLGRHIIDNDRPKAGRPPGSRETSGDDILDASFGVKVNPWKNVLVLFNVLVPLNDTGLRDDIVPLFGLEVSF